MFLFMSSNIVFLEIAIGLKSDDDEGSYEVLHSKFCRESIQQNLSVLSWHPIIRDNEPCLSDEPFVQLIETESLNTAQLKDTLVKRTQFRNLKAVFVIGKIPSSILNDFKSHVPLLIIPPCKVLKDILHSRRREELLFSSVPLLSSEMKQKSLGILSCTYCLLIYDCVS